MNDKVLLALMAAIIYTDCHNKAEAIEAANALLDAIDPFRNR